MAGLSRKVSTTRAAGLQFRNAFTTRAKCRSRLHTQCSVQPSTHSRQFCYVLANIVAATLWYIKAKAATEHHINAHNLLRSFNVEYSVLSLSMAVLEFIMPVHSYTFHSFSKVFLFTQPMLKVHVRQALKRRNKKEKCKYTVHK